MVDLRHDLADREPAHALCPGDGESEVDQNVFQVLARQARTRTPRELWLTTVGGLLGLLWWLHPALSWLAAGCAAAAAYGLWGLLDRAARARMDAAKTDRATIAQLRGLRDLTALLGTGAAVWAVLDFIAAALGGWRH